MGSRLLRWPLGTRAVKRLGVFIAGAGCCFSFNVGGKGKGRRMEGGNCFGFCLGNKIRRDSLVELFSMNFFLLACFADIKLRVVYRKQG